LRSGENRLAAERAELDAILASGILGRSNYVVRLLTFVCDKYFDDETAEVKEYSIAVHALGRSADFDPQADTIVRVTAHTLRKRLEEYYRTDGAGHPIHICIPSGRYVPNFVHRNAAETQGTSGREATATGGANGAAHGNAADQASRNAESRRVVSQEIPIAPESAARPRRVAGIAGSVAAVACLFLIAFYVWPRAGQIPYGQAQAAAAPPISPGTSAVRAIIGMGRKAYTDQAGFEWSVDKFCSGGDSFSVSKPEIQGTGDPSLFEGGRWGVFNCKFPVPPGSYEMHLFFAETAGLQENARTVGYTINGTADSLDVVDDSGADDTATAKIFTGVQPESDGAIHLDFTAPQSFLNAVEILPDPAQQPLPIRILAGRETAYRDEEGRLWFPDRDFFGGRRSSNGSDERGLANGGIYESQRIGHFHYSIPVASGRQYTLRLHFIERWFGIQNQNVGGAGSRVFDVSCNGAEILKNFDIMREAQNAPLVKTFTHIQPTPQDKIEVYFTPNVNYPSLSAIEILPE
jgi:hypothetical protein